MTSNKLADSESQSVLIPINGSMLQGDLTIPQTCSGIVLFAHGSGSSRKSSRNRFVAETLQDAHLATLLVDLLTEQEEDEERLTHHLRFDIELLARRLQTITYWLSHYSSTQGLSLGYFGSSTGAAAALVAAARCPDQVSAVVSRGGRPDLANGGVLRHVRAPTLLIVGGNDIAVARLNEEALTELTGAAERQLLIVPGATHLFEEKGSLETAARFACEWFGRYLVGAGHVVTGDRT